MSRYLLTFTLLASTILAPGLCAKKGHEKHGRDAQDRRTAVFRSAGLPPGLAKRGGDLPPGLAKQLRRNGRLPPGLEKRLVPFPVELERRLPPLPPHYRRCFVGDRAIIYDQRTGIIVDTLTVAIKIGR
jgi:hypothetical protein